METGSDSSILISSFLQNLKVNLIMKILFISLVLIVLSTGSHAKTIKPNSEAERLEYLNESFSWFSEKDNDRTILDGPKQNKTWKNISFNQIVTCSFEEPSIKNKPNGKTPKFWCIDGAGHRFKVKYESQKEKNIGIYGEILSTRLFWALGFPADAIYPVIIHCKNCPKYPWRYMNAIYAKAKYNQGGILYDKELELLQELSRPRLQILEIKNAVIEFKFPYPKIESYAHQGWSWKELSRGNTEIQKTQRDAMALLASFIQHADNKSEQQRLVCLEKKGKKCIKTIAMIQDLGFSFGAGYTGKGNKRFIEGTANLQGFIDAPIWSDSKKCITKVNYFEFTGENINRKISEEGRKYLVKLLENLTDNDIINLFVSARFYLKEDVYKLDSSPSITKWVKAFKKKVKKISNHNCPK